MSIPLKYATVSQEIPLGMFVDSSDGDTEETGLTIANTDIQLWKAGATSLVNKNSGGATHMSNGVYYCVLDNTDTNTYGPLVIFVHVSGALYVRVECEVLQPDAYDALYGSSGYISSNITRISNDATAAQNLESYCDGTTPQPVNATQIEGSDATDQIRDALVDDATRIDASALNTLSGHDPGEAIAGASDISGLNDPTAASIADAVWDEAASGHTSAGTFGEQCGTDIDAILTDTNELQGDDVPGLIAALNDPNAAAIADAVWDETLSGHSDAGSTGEALDNAGSGSSAADIADAVWDEAQADHTSAGTFGLIASEIATIDGIVDDILVDTGTTLDGKLDTIDGNVDSILIDTGTTLQAELDGIQADTEDLQTQIGSAGAGLTAVPWNASWDAEVQSECTDALNAYDPPTRTELTSDKDEIITEVDANETKIDTIDGIVDAILTDTDTTIPGLISALNDLDADGVWDEVVEGALTGRQAVRIMLAVLAGKSTGGGTTTIRFRDVADSKNRVDATVDVDNNRDAVTLDGE